MGGGMTGYYNEVDPYAAQWLRNLVAAGHIAPGDVDERSIVDVQPDDVRGYDQCHWFAGIAGWSLALRLAGWPDDRPVWTGSCPCQPFSTAGKGAGGTDERHLWPHWFRLIRECRPATILGEQVEAAIGWGWLDAVFADLEAEGYAAGAAVLPACSVGAPHVRNRLWFVADSGGVGDREGRWLRCEDEDISSGAWRGMQSESCDGGVDGDLADADRCGRLGDATGPRLQERGNGSLPSVAGGTDTRQAAQRAGASVHFWSDVRWLPCTDGKARPTKPGIQPLAHGVPARVGKLRAAGNAIVPQVAAEFIRAMKAPA
jgi:DNA (cytosine-5)-methyltransferase 1